VQPKPLSNAALLIAMRWANARVQIQHDARPRWRRSPRAADALRRRIGSLTLPSREMHPGHVRYGSPTRTHLRKCPCELVGVEKSDYR
jgi:hypothetical protein